MDQATCIQVVVWDIGAGSLRIERAVVRNGSHSRAAGRIGSAFGTESSKYQ